MSAETLRQAAAEMHADARAMSDHDNAWVHAVADWLELMTEPGRGDDPDEYAAAIKVAEAYLGSDS